MRELFKNLKISGTLSAKGKLKGKAKAPRARGKAMLKGAATDGRYWVKIGETWGVGTVSDGMVKFEGIFCQPVQDFLKSGGILQHATPLIIGDEPEGLVWFASTAEGVTPGIKSAELIAKLQAELAFERAERQRLKLVIHDATKVTESLTKKVEEFEARIGKAG